MTVTRIISVFFSATLLVTMFSSDASAQIFARSKQRFLRLIGQGFGDGYHVNNPGPNSDYYNPYSVYNSTLVDPVLRQKYFGYPIQQFAQPSIPNPPVLQSPQLFHSQSTPSNPQLGGGDFDPTTFQVPAGQTPAINPPSISTKPRGSAKKQPIIRRPAPRKSGSGSKGSAAKKTSVAVPPAIDNDFHAFDFPVFDDN